MKKKIIILSLVFVLLLGIGITLSLTYFNEDYMNRMTEKKIYNRERNNKKKIKEKHCLDNICINSMEIVNEYEDIRVISGELENISNDTLEAGTITLEFKVGKETYTEIIYYDTLLPNQSAYFETHHDNEFLVKAIDYKMK